MIPNPILGLMRRVAKAGPGHLGIREAMDDDQRSELSAALQAGGADVPPYLEKTVDWIDRPAKIFESGEYPEKAVSIDAAHLERLAAHFDLPVPILIEHSNSPLELGYLSQVVAEGDELFGTITLTQQANDLIEQSGARSLSVGLSSDLERIEEVSLVTTPRVASAQLYSDSPSKPGKLLDLPTRAPQNSHGKHAERIEGWIREGKLLPAQARFAEGLLQDSHRIKFDGSSTSVAQLTAALIESGPSHHLFGEVATQPSPASHALFLPEEAAFYQRYFPEISLDDIAQRARTKSA